MKLGIMQPYFLPYLGYWQLLNFVDEYVVYDDVNFITRGWISRNRILVQERPQYINLVMAGASRNKRICDIFLYNDDIRWRKKLLTTIEMAYHKAPYFCDVYSMMEQVMESKESRLSEFIFSSIAHVCNYLGITTPLRCSSDLHCTASLKGEDRILDICTSMKATEYYNAIGGKSLYSYERFKERNIELFFLCPELPEYRQFGNAFVKNLSILDVMMFNSVEQIREMLQCYRLEQS